MRDTLARDTLARDTLQALAACLTREQAGRLLAPLCRAGAALVRGADAAEDGGAPALWLAGVAPWDLDRTRARVAAEYADSRRPWWLEHVRILNSFARELEEMREAGVVQLVFDRAPACAGTKASLLGCHKLVVLRPFEFLETTEDWMIMVARYTADAALALYTRGAPPGAAKTPSRAVLAVLRGAGLHARGRCARDARVIHNEALWHTAYCAENYGRA